MTASRTVNPSSNTPRAPLDAATVGEIIQMALSDHVAFDHIRLAHGLTPDEVKALMRQQLASGSHRAWRKRVRQFSQRWPSYKSTRTILPEQR